MHFLLRPTVIALNRPIAPSGSCGGSAARAKMSLRSPALERLVQLKNRPGIVAKAESDLTERTVVLCEQRLGPLGAEVNMVIDRIDATTVGPVLVVRLGEKWQGTQDDLRRVSQMRQQRNFRLEGAAIDDNLVKMFAEKEKLAYLQLINTKVTPDAVDLLKTKHPDATVHVRNQALLGVSAENHPAGVLVTFVHAPVRPQTRA